MFCYSWGWAWHLKRSKERENEHPQEHHWHPGLVIPQVWIPHSTSVWETCLCGCSLLLWTLNIPNWMVTMGIANGKLPPARHWTEPSALLLPHFVCTGIPVGVGSISLLLYSASWADRESERLSNLTAAAPLVRLPKSKMTRMRFGAFVVLPWVLPHLPDPFSFPLPTVETANCLVLLDQIGQGRVVARDRINEASWIMSSFDFPAK